MTSTSVRHVERHSSLNADPEFLGLSQANPMIAEISPKGSSIVCLATEANCQQYVNLTVKF